jgi:hypothetical protein
MLALGCLLPILGRLPLGTPLVADHNRPEHTQQPQAGGERDRGGQHHQGFLAAQRAQTGQSRLVVGVGGRVDLLLDRPEQGVDLVLVDGQHPFGVSGVHGGEHPRDGVQIAVVLSVQSLFQDPIGVVPTLVDVFQGSKQRGGRLLIPGSHLGAWFQTVLALQ